MVITGISSVSCSDDKKTTDNKQSPAGNNSLEASPNTKDSPDTKKAQATTPVNPNTLGQDGKKTKSSFSILDRIHKDTVLKRIRLPRYDKNFIPLSLLSAEKMEVIGGQQIRADGVSVELYNPDGSIKARTKMRHAHYKEDTATLEAKEAIYIDGEGFKASGSGLVFDLETRRGFVLGPASTIFQIKQPNPAKEVNLDQPH